MVATNHIKLEEKLPCKQCGGKIKVGVALDQTFTGVPDFIGSSEVVTMSPGGSGKLVACLKCSECGWIMR